MAQHLLDRANERGGDQRTGFTPQALSALTAYDWPGNLRRIGSGHRLSHIRRPERPLVAIEDLPSSIRGQLSDGYPSTPHTNAIKPLDELLTEVERRLIETGLKQARGNKSRAAELLGISRPRLYRRIKELNLPDDGESVDESDASR